MPVWWRSIGAYLGAVGSQWSTAVSLLGSLLAFSGPALGFTTPPWVWIPLSLGGFFVANVVVFHRITSRPSAPTTQVFNIYGGEHHYYGPGGGSRGVAPLERPDQDGEGAGS